MKNLNELIKTSKQIRIMGILEGISYLVLLFVAMPLKYFADMPNAVKYTGWIHGILFIVFMWAIVLGYLNLKWTLRKSATAFIASLLPFGTIIFDRQLKKDEALL